MGPDVTLGRAVVKEHLYAQDMRTLCASLSHGVRVVCTACKNEEECAQSESERACAVRARSAEAHRVAGRRGVPRDRARDVLALGIAPLHKAREVRHHHPRTHLEGA